MKYGLIIDNPKDFFHEIHRPSHFLQFSKAHEEDYSDFEDKFS
jgi:pre-mRNA-processing factor 8